MPLFGSSKPPKPTEEELEAAEVDLERIRQGGIPLGAEQRLKRIANAGTPFFTSDLSAKEYAVSQLSDLRPVAQVMGSSVVQHGWSNTQGQAYGAFGRGGMFGGMREITALAEPWNIARGNSFGRLRQEAELAGADAVIGIEMSSSSSFADPGNVEYVVFGTAVRDDAFARGNGQPLGMCALSGQDVDKLRRIGAEPCGIVGYTTVVSVPLMMGSNYVMNSGGWLGGAGAQNTEIREITEGVYQARQLVMANVRRQASAVGANNIVISTLNHAIEHREFDGGGGTVHYFYVTMHVLGTAIQIGAHKPHPVPFEGPAMSINLGKTRNRRVVAPK